MLTHLSVSNYALIESLELDFNRGFTAITGETGVREIHPGWRSGSGTWQQGRSGCSFRQSTKMYCRGCF